jgi:hypothetical protein
VFPWDEEGVVCALISFLPTSSYMHECGRYESATFAVSDRCSFLV